MIRVAHFSDLHYGTRTLAEADRCFGAAIDRAIALGVEAAVISGDATDHPLDLHAPAAVRLIAQVRRLADHCPVLMLQGTYSHEPPGTLAVFRLLGGRHPVHVADRIGQVALTVRAEWIDSKGWRFDAVPPDARALFSCVPTVNKAAVAAMVSAAEAAQAVGEQLAELLRGYAPIHRAARAQGLPTIGVSHGTVFGCISEHGVPMAGFDHEFTTGALFGAEAQAFMLGHIHRHQTWVADGASGQQCIAYPGSIGRFHYGEEGDKGFLVWDVGPDGARCALEPTPARRTLDIVFEGKPDLDVLRSVVEQQEVGGAFVRVRWVVADEDRHEVDRAAILRLLAGAVEAKLEGRRSQLQGECVAANQSSIQAIEALKAQDRGEQQRLDRLQQRVAHRASQESSRWSALQDRRRKCLDALKQAAAVRRAESRLPLAEIVLAARAARVTTWRRQVQCLTECQGAIRTAEQKLSATLREAGQAAIRADDLARRFGLTSAVPCAGTDLQGQCQLLGDAREASTLIPSAQAAIARLAHEKASIDVELATLRSQRDALFDAPTTLSRVEVECERARARVARLAQWSAKSAEIAQARAAQAEIDQELVAAASPGATDGQPVETTEEQAERHQIDSTRQEIANQIERQSQQLRATLDRLQAALGSMPAAFDVRRLTEAKSAMDLAARATAAAERTHLDAVRDAEALAGLTLQAAAVATRQARAVGRIARVETELSNWNLFTRCMSNDGLIALAIDDAGPALSGLANDLLLACYGTRFTVSILTLLETGKGDQKEGFDIVVHDGESSESKSVGLMSGGERVFVNECLIRAVALYLAQHTGRQYNTLFSDEADGPLDPERKRMFMAMKREVLKLGGYAREFFVSQTPELTAMADAVIDLEVFAATGEHRAAA